MTVCGAVDPAVELGSLVCFDDLHFLANRLGDGELCTFYAEPGDPLRGHWIFEDPFSARAARPPCCAGAAEAGVPVRDGGCYGHVDGPRFNTRAEIRGLAACGVTAVSQTAGPETVLCGEAELPYALLGYATDYANGVQDEPTPVETLMEMMAASTEAFARVLAAAVPLAAAAEPRAGRASCSASAAARRTTRTRAEARPETRSSSSRNARARGGRRSAGAPRRSGAASGPAPASSSSDAGPASPPPSSSSSEMMIAPSRLSSAMSTSVPEKVRRRLRRAGRWACRTR